MPYYTCDEYAPSKDFPNSCRDDIPCSNGYFASVVVKECKNFSDSLGLSMGYGMFIYIAMTLVGLLGIAFRTNGASCDNKTLKTLWEELSPEGLSCEEIKDLKKLLQAEQAKKKAKEGDPEAEGGDED